MKLDWPKLRSITHVLPLNFFSALEGLSLDFDSGMCAFITFGFKGGLWNLIV